ncbi:hypothetical protein BH10ACI2_BH10ACI2_05720 [soil metagenome]
MQRFANRPQNATVLPRRASLIEMKKVFAVILFLCFLLPVFGQEKPLTQAEYVKMLYSLQKDPGSKADIVEALRKRGIDFVLNDGVRGLTRSKAANDDELKRALEEADRRRANPVATKLPSSKESAALLETARKKTLEAVGDMPDFVVKQQVQRFAAYAGTGNFRPLDRLIVAVSYRSSGEEDYKVLSINGILQNAVQAKGSYEDVGGTSSTGEFVTMLATIFKPESDGVFELVDADLIRGRRALVFDFSVDKEHAKQVITAVGATNNSTITGMKGRLWIDRDDARILRVESEATEIPATFPVRSAKRSIDYDWVKIVDEKYLLPSVSDVRLTMREKANVYETRNLIKFKDYQKYGSEVKILDDDIKPEPDPIKP